MSTISFFTVGTGTFSPKWPAKRDYSIFAGFWYGSREAFIVQLARVGTTIRDDLWRWQVGNRGHPFGGIGSIHTRTEHGFVLRARMLGPELYDKCLSGAIPKPGKDAIVSKYALLRRVLDRRQPFFEDIQALTRYMVFDSWHHLMDFMIQGLELPPQLDTS